MQSLRELRCEGAFGAIETPHAFCFRIYPDQQLVVSVAAIQREQSLEFSVVHGHAFPMSDGLADNAQFIGEFSVVRWDKKRVSEGVVMDCTVILSSLEGVSGEFFEAHEPDIAPHFDLPITGHCCMKPIAGHCFPLTPGAYELQGFIQKGNGALVTCSLDLEMLPDGSLVGSLVTKLHRTESHLLGIWTQDRLHFTRQPTARTPSADEFDATVSLAGLCGSWKHADSALVNDPAQHGVFGFELVASKRTWSTQWHNKYPPAFQKSTKWLLLSSRRTNAMPSALWPIVLSYCDFHWFDSA